MAVQLREEIDELKRKLALLGWWRLESDYPVSCLNIFVPFPLLAFKEGDRKAYQENSQYSIEQNKEKIAKLRSDNKQLRVKLANRLKVR